METNRTPAAQPLMYNQLQDIMEAKCKNKDPVWPALLATWFQATGCLRLGLIIRRSSPVERFDGWLLFFCKRGKHKHNMQGFYWGVPDHTSTNWDWATPFIELYQSKRASDKGNVLMGAVFTADTFEHFTPRAVNLITQAAIQEVTKDPDSLGAFSWRSYLPTMAIAVASSDEERLALGDWRDKELLKQSEAITLRYADAKSGMSRRIKTKLSRVQQSL